MNRSDVLRYLGTLLVSILVQQRTRARAATVASDNVAPIRPSIKGPDAIWAAAQSRLASTSRGRRLLKAISRSSNDLRMLTTSHRRVAAVWKRLDGIGWAERIFVCLGDNSMSFPYERNGKTLDSASLEFLTVLHRHGAPALILDSTTIRDALVMLPGKSFDEVVGDWESLRWTWS